MIVETPYIYAKACAVFARSFSGRRMSELKSVSSLDALLTAVFGVSVSGETITDLEERFMRREKDDIEKIVGAFARPPKFLTMLQKAGSLDDGAAGASPDNTAESAMAAVAEDASKYYTKLWRTLSEVPYSERMSITHLLSEEIRLKNAVWALRLRLFYNMKREKAEPYLMKMRSKDALDSFGFDPEEETHWDAWPLKRFVNKSEQGKYWKLNVSYFQNKAALYLYSLARNGFRANPFSYDTAACFIKLKMFERELLTAVAEALRLGISGEEAFKSLGLDLGEA